MDLKYKRVLLKMSGEVLKGSDDGGIDGEKLMSLAKEVKEVWEAGCEIGLVIGGGNIWRFRDNDHLTLDRVTSDTMGMMATVMNALAFSRALKSLGVSVKVVSALSCPKAMDDYVPLKAREEMAKGSVMIFAGGTGSPFFTTDSAAALRALEMDCDVLLKATKVDYVYDKDPQVYDDAIKYEEMTFKEVLDQSLGVMDLTCASLCESGDLPMVVFNLNVSGNVLKVVCGEKLGTLITK